MSKVKKSQDVLNIAVNYEHIYDLLGKLLTLNDATMSSETQRKAQKSLIKLTVYQWADRLYAVQHPGEFKDEPINLEEPIEPYNPIMDKDNR